MGRANSEGWSLVPGLQEYELVVILSPEIQEDNIDASIEKVQQSITSRGGEVTDTNHWGRRRLAYPIKRHLEGNYVVSQIKLDPASVAGLESGLRISEDVLRHLIIKTDE